MNPVLVIAFWATLFVGAHLVISSDAIRPRLVNALGDQPYRGVYSLIVFALFIPMLINFAHHRHAGAMLWNLRQFAPLRGVTSLLMLAAFIFLVGGFINQSPSSVTVGPATDWQITGILKITRHPFFVAFVLFALGHLLMNGWVGDIWFFGSFATLAILGGRHQDHRKVRELGEPYRALLEQTSFFPGAALMSGRQRWTSADMPWSAIALGAAVTIVVLMLHPLLFGGSPLG